MKEEKNMLRVMLVDDEPFIAQGLTRLVNWEQEGYEVAAVKGNGKEALDFLREEKVDLIIADIRMPVMDGLELLETIRKENISDAQFIFLSGYGDFSYAQRAIQLNCLEYILKPVEKEKLLEVLRKVAHLSENAKQDEENLKKMEQAYLARNVISLLIGKYDEQNLKYVKEHMFLPRGGMRFIDIETNLFPMDDEEEAVLRENQRKLYESCVNILKDYSSHVIFDVSYDEKSYDTGIIFCDFMATQKNMEEGAYLEQFQEKLQSVLNQPVRMFVGKKVTDIAMISKSYSSACILKSLVAFHFKKNIYYYEKEVQIGNNGVLLCKKGLDDLISCIEKNEQNSIGDCVENLYTEMMQLGAQSDVINLNINYLLFQLIHLASEQDNEINQDEILRFISESTFEEGVSRGSSEHMTRFAIEYAEYLSQLRKNMSNSIVAQVEKEIRTHYKENLSLKELGKKFYVNSSYLGQIFQKKYGQSFKDYLCHLRINEAARLLVTTDKKIQEIAEEIGYKDSDYFIRKFIEIKGCTPSKYRKNEY